MSILKLLPLMYLVTKATATWLPRSLQQHQKVNVFHEDYQNCVCQMQLPTVIDKLDSDHSGIERLVIYVYRKPKTGEIISFVPNKEHQIKMPDFPETYGNIHYIDQNLSIRQVFENSPSKHLRAQDRSDEPAPQHKSSEVIQIDGKIPKDFNEQHFGIDSNFPKWQIPFNQFSQNQIQTEYVNSYSHQKPKENTYQKTEIITNTFKPYVDSAQHITEDISSEYLPEKKNVRVETISVKPFESNNIDLDISSIKPISVHPIEFQDLSSETSSEYPTPGGIKLIKHKEWSTSGDRPHPTNLVWSSQEREPPGEIELVRHKEWSSSHNSYPRHYTTEISQIITDSEENIVPTVQKIKVPRIDKNDITLDWNSPEHPTPGGIDLIRHKEWISSDDSNVRHRPTEITEISDSEGNIVPSVQKIKVPRIDQHDINIGWNSPTPDGINLIKHKEWISSDDSYVTPRLTETTEISDSEENIVPSVHKTKVPRIDNHDITIGWNSPEYPTPGGIDLIRHKEWISSDDSNVRHRPTEITEISDSEGNIVPSVQKIKMPRIDKHDINIGWNSPTPDGINLIKHKEWISSDDSYVRPRLTETTEISDSEENIVHKTKVPRIDKHDITIGWNSPEYQPGGTNLIRHKEWISSDDSNVRPRPTEKMEISDSEDNIVPSVQKVKEPRIDKYERTISWSSPEHQTPGGIELIKHKEWSSTDDADVRPHPTEITEISESEENIVPSVQKIGGPHLDIHGKIIGWNSVERATPDGFKLLRHKEWSSSDESNIRHHPTEIAEFSDSEANINPSYKKIKVPRFDMHGRIIGWTIKTIKTNWKGGIKHRDVYKPSSYGHYYVVGLMEKDPAFDYWLKEQLRITTLNGNIIPTSSADIMTLDRAIRNVLLQNGWLVTGYGTLTDGHGKTSSLRNLKLRPIMVGRSFSYDRLVKSKNTQEKSKPPYLEGLLLTMIKPAQILGIVPLSITSLPQSQSMEQNSEVTITAGSSKSKGQRAVLKVLPIEELVSFRKDSRSSKPPKPKVSRLSSKNKSKDIAFLKKALTEVSRHGNPIAPKKEDGPWNYNFLGKNHKLKSKKSEEVPGWRIIGGNPATGSGTPLDFKGRSGLYG